MAPFLAVALVSPPKAVEGTWGDLDFDVVACVVFVAGGAFRLWATLYIGGKKNQALITEGPYSICRNPLYVGTFLMALSLVLFLQSLTLAVGLTIATVVYLSVTVPQEERRLRLRMGAAYDDYCRRVPRFWPAFSNFHTPQSIEVNIRGLAIECRRATLWLWIPAIGELAGHLRALAWWPHVLPFP